MQQPFSKLGFARSVLLPALLLFVVPAFGSWFAGHATRSVDEEILENVRPQIAADAQLSNEEKAAMTAFYENVPPSVACLSDDPELSGYRDNVGSTCSDYEQFAWARFTSGVAILVGILGVVIAIGSAAVAFRSRKAQYGSFAFGWNALKVIGAIETLLQGAMLVWLSFWMTAIWFHSYFVKLILLAGIGAAIAVFLVLRAIFTSPPQVLHVEGKVLSEADAPALWARVRSLCERLATRPPARIIAGIDSNFFVTEVELALNAFVGGSSLEAGERMPAERTLYVSLPLLETLSKDEADAVLAHEMAHLGGGDTEASKNISPLISRFQHYLRALFEGVVTLPIYYFMLAYFALFTLALSKSARERELEADAAAARITSPLHIARALVKVGAYASFRNRVEDSLFAENAKHDELGIANRIQAGFADYVATPKLAFDLHDAVIPHPFDTHPPLRERMKNVGAELSDEECKRALEELVEGTWLDEIADARTIAKAQWDAYEARFAADHAFALALRYEPANDEERAHVEKYFPPIEFRGQKKPEESLRIDCDKLTYYDWPEPLRFESVESASLDDGNFRKSLVLKVRGGGNKKVVLSKLADEGGSLDAFNRYYGRHLAMRQHKANRIAPA